MSGSHAPVWLTLDVRPLTMINRQLRHALAILLILSRTSLCLADENVNTDLTKWRVHFAGGVLSTAPVATLFSDLYAFLDVALYDYPKSSAANAEAILISGVYTGMPTFFIGSGLLIGSRFGFDKSEFDPKIFREPQFQKKKVSFLVAGIVAFVLGATTTAVSSALLPQEEFAFRNYRSLQVGQLFAGPRLMHLGSAFLFTSLRIARQEKIKAEMIIAPVASQDKIGIYATKSF